MRLRNPLQGIKMMGLNFLSHLIFFILITFFQDDSSPHDNGDLSPEQSQMQIDAVTRLKWGHLVCFVAQVTCLILKQNQDYIYIAQVILILINVSTYFLPLLWALFVFKETNLNPSTLEVDNRYEGLLQLELMFFISWFIGVCLFIFVAFLLKF